MKTRDEQIEYQARCSMNCVCGNGKEQNSLVCWDCFKRGDKPLKWSNLSYAEWLDAKGFELPICGSCNDEYHAYKKADDTGFCSAHCLETFALTR